MLENLNFSNKIKRFNNFKKSSLFLIKFSDAEKANNLLKNLIDKGIINLKLIIDEIIDK